MHSTNPAEETPVAPRRPWFWQPTLIVFVSSACVMVLELVAGRIIAPHVGVSLYTWTSVIGIVLAGISLGNYVGGLLADRYASLGLLGGIFCLAGLSSLGILGVEKLNILGQVTWPLVPQILLLITALFFIPAAILGTISPIVAKLAVRDLAKAGSAVGRIYAAGSIGSIVGTFATGFFLISWFGTHAIIWGVAIVLLLLSLLLFIAGNRRWMVLPIFILVAGSMFAIRQEWLRSTCTRETNYFCISVHEDDKGSDRVRVLVLDRLVHSYSSLDDPTKLVYGYEKAYAEATAYKAMQVGRLSTLFIGGGGYTFPRYVEAVYPGSVIDVIEIDPGVTEIAYEMLGLSRDTDIVTYNEDARMFLEREPSRTYHIIFGDAFNDYSVPYHLTTREFNERVRAWLDKDGLYIVNIIDGAGGDFLRAYTHTLRQTFQNVYVAPTIETWREASRSTFVLIGTDTPLALGVLATIDAGDGATSLSPELLSQQDVDALLGEKRVVMLTDRYAPVDQMLAPVFTDKVDR
jgi:spermidine synthase